MIYSLDDKIRVFRDDLFPFLGGGNKGRKILAIAQDVRAKLANAVVTTGGVQSNHCRALAVLAAQNKWRCTLVLHGSKERFEFESGNAKIMRLSGADIVFVKESSEIGLAMDNAMDRYSAQGLSPYYVQGGGHTMEGGGAYIDAVSELKAYSYRERWLPDYVFIASGTGSTQAGILAGLDKYGFKNTAVIGISVARRREVAEMIVREFYNSLCNHYDITCSGRQVVVLDDYLSGGYERFNHELTSLCENSIKEYGFALDSTYSGKAFYGMLDYIKCNRINGNVLFWHTGGIFNFLAR